MVTLSCYFLNCWKPKSIINRYGNQQLKFCKGVINMNNMIFNNVPFPYQLPSNLPDFKLLPKVSYDGLWQPIIFCSPITNEIYPNVEPGRYVLFSNGCVFDSVRNIIQYHVPLNGYYYTGIYTEDGVRHDVGMHTLVAKAFCEPRQIIGRHEVNHIDGIKSHNEYYNLENCSSSENRIHAYTTGLRKIGEEHDSNTKLSNEQVHQICDMLSKGYMIKEIAQIMQSQGVNSDNIVGLINAIKKRRVWTHISKYYDFPEPSINYKLTNSQIHEICRIAKATSNYSPSFLLDQVYDTSSLSKKEIDNLRYSVGNILRGKRHRDIASMYNLETFTE